MVYPLAILPRDLTKKTSCKSGCRHCCRVTWLKHKAHQYTNPCTKSVWSFYYHIHIIVTTIHLISLSFLSSRSPLRCLMLCFESACLIFPLSPSLSLSLSHYLLSLSLSHYLHSLSLSHHLCLSICLSACLSVSLHHCLGLRLSITLLCLSLSLCVCLSVCLTDYLSVCQYVWLSVCLSLCLHICFSVSVCLCLSACPHSFLPACIVCIFVCL